MANTTLEATSMICWRVPRAQVWHGTAHQTSGGLKRDDLKMHRGRIVSKRKTRDRQDTKALGWDIFNLREVVYLEPSPRRERSTEPRSEEEPTRSKYSKYQDIVLSLP